MDTPKFGELLQRYRENTKDPQAKQGANKPLSGTRFAALVAQAEGRKKNYNGTTVWRWENGHELRPRTERGLLLAICKVLLDYRGIISIEEANALLEAGGYLQLSHEEARQIGFSAVTVVVDPKNPINRLPADPYGKWFGREDEIHKAIELLTRARSTPAVHVWGPGGIGKTAFVHEVSKTMLQRGMVKQVIWTTAKEEYFRGESIHEVEQPYDIEYLLAEIAYECDRADILDKPLRQRKAEVRRLFIERKILLILDNLEVVKNVETLLEEIRQIQGRAKLLLTGRWHINLDFLASIRLSGLSEQDTIALLRWEGNDRNIDTLQRAKDDTLRQIYLATEGAPLALKLIAGQLTQLLPLAQILETLKRASASGDHYEFYKFLYRASWLALRTYSRKLMIAMSGTEPRSGIARGDILAMSDMDSLNFNASIKQLTTMSLIEFEATREGARYMMHTLTLNFVQSDILQLTTWGQVN